MVLHGAVDDAFAFATLPSFGAAFGAAFDLPATGVARSRLAGTGVSAIAIRWASDMWMPHLGRWSSRCLMLL